MSVVSSFVNDNINLVKLYARVRHRPVSEVRQIIVSYRRTLLDGLLLCASICCMEWYSSGKLKYSL
jgi:hypothetical protein